MKNYIFNTLIENFHFSFNLAALISIVPVIIFPSIDTWLDANIDYILIALIFISIDQALGTLSHSRYYMNDFDMKKNITGFFVKISMVVAFGFLMEGLAHIVIEDEFIYKYIKMVGRLLVLIYPGYSAMKNMKIITKGDFPSDAMMGKFGRFKDTGDLNEFRDNNNQNN